MAASSLDPSGPLAVGQSFSPRYHIIKILGVGGMGAVYQAWDAELSVAVALKVIRADRRRGSALPAAERRFKHELLLARQVTHKNVVRIHDLGEIDGIKYITMPYIQGDDLATVLRRDGPLPIARALRLAREIAGGLEAAHDAGVVHRDLKPANIMIGGAGDDEHALIMDFGISASADEAADGRIVGTLEYMSPEQGLGQLVDARSDLYAFALILYEMLVGRRSARTTTAEERFAAMKQRFEQGLPPLRTWNESIPEPLAALVARGLERGSQRPVPDDRRALRRPCRARRRRRADSGPGTNQQTAVAGEYCVVAGVAGRDVRRRAPLRAGGAAAARAGLGVDRGFLRTPPAIRRSTAPWSRCSSWRSKTPASSARTIGAVINRSLGVRPPEKLDERAALELAVKQGLGVVLSGSVERQGSGYGVSVKATQAVTGNVITTARNRASNKDQVLGAATKAANAVREALGDDTSEADKRFAMETLSATSLEVVREYAKAADAMSRARYSEALQNFSTAITLDPNFGLGYAGMASASRNLDKQQDAEKYIKEAVRHLDSMTERERYRTRGLSFMITADYQACVKEFGDLVAKYSADASARNNRAVCLASLRQTSEALDEMRQVVKILPKRALYRENLATYAAYNSDFRTAEQEARAMQEPGTFGLLPLAYAQLLQGQLPQAAETYERIGTIDEQGASYRASGLGDLALYEGRLSDAVQIFSQGAAADLESKDTDRAANKFAALAYTQVLRQQKGAAIVAAEKALANSNAVKIRFLAARVFLEAGVVAKARTLATALAAELQAEPQAYAKIIDGEIALKAGDPRQAIKVLTEANALLDTWTGHFDLGRAYLEAGAFTQADAEFDRCIQRRGEALALFLDEEPTYGYFPPVYYYQGRVREGLNNAGFAESYRAYLGIRGAAGEDPLLAGSPPAGRGLVASCYGVFDSDVVQAFRPARHRRT